MNYLSRVSSIEDFEAYYLVKSDRSAVNWSGYASAPDKKMLLAHFEKLIAEPDTYLFLFRNSETNEVLGYAQLNRESATTIEYSGYSLLHKFHNQGLNRKLTALIIEKAFELKCQKIVGWISEKNYASIRWLQSFGMRNTGESRVVRLEALQRNDVYYLYEKTL